VLAPAELTVGGHAIQAYMAIVGFGSAITLWGTSLVIWRMGWELLRAARLNRQA